MLEKKRKKRRTTESLVTPTHGSFRSSKFDTVADLTRLIFLCKEIVQGRSISGSSARQCENSKKLIDRNSMHNVFRRYELDTGGRFGQAHLLYIAIIQDDSTQADNYSLRLVDALH